MTPDDPLRTPGQVLKEARERAGLSLAEMAERTKIAPPMLESIERDEYHRLSDPLYVKSFLRTCAVEVGLDPDEVLGLYGRSTGSATLAPGSEGVWEEKTVTINRVGLPWGRIVPVVAGAAVVALVVVLVLRGCDGGEDTGPESASPPPEQAGAVAQRESLLAPAGDPVVTADETPAETPVESPSGMDVAEQAEDQPAAADVEPDPLPATVTQPTTPVRQLPTVLAGEPGLNMAGPYRGDLVLRVLASGPVRVRVRRDGEHVYRTVDLGGEEAAEDPLPAQGIVPGRAYAVREGSVVYWRARDHFSLKLDPVAGVTVTVNGRERDLSRLRSGQEMILDSHAAD